MRVKKSLAIVFLLSMPVYAADGDANAALDKQLFDVLKELNNRGADLNNAKDPVGCYRTYQGGLLVAKMMMAHRPAAQKVIDDGLQAAERKPLPERAFALHTTITELRAVLKPAMTPIKPSVPGTPPANAEQPKLTAAPLTNPLPASFPGPAMPAPILTATLWDRLGGEAKVQTVVDQWLTLSLADAKVDLTKGGTQKLEGEAIVKCRQRLVGYVSTLTEGTVPYVGKSMTDAHAGIPTQGEAFTAFVAHLKTALTKNGAATADVDALVKKVEETK